MNKRTFLSILPALAIVFAVSLAAQQPTPAHQPPLASPAPAPQPLLAPPTPATAPQPTPAVAVQPAPKPAASSPEPARRSGNVRIDVTLTDQAANAAPIKKTMSVVVARSGSVRSGLNVPTTQMTLGAVGGGGVNSVPITTYNYRTLGLSLDVRSVSVDNNGISVSLSIEYNPIDEASEKTLGSPTAPWANFSQSFSVELENGKPLLVAQTSDPVPNRNRTLSVEVKATLVK